MSVELIATGFVMGLAGAGHCAVMCGPVCGALGGRRAAAPEGPAGVAGRSVIVRFERDAAGMAGRTPLPVPGGFRGQTPELLPARFLPAGTGAGAGSVEPLGLNVPLLVLLASRLASYAAAGAVVAASVAGLAALGSSLSMLRPFWVLLHVAALALGLWLLVVGRQPPLLVAAFERLRPRGPAATGAMPLAQSARSAASASWRRAAVAGSGWVLLPCGLLQSALVTASLASSPWAGGAVMAAFALASSAGLLAAPTLMALMRRVGGRSGEQAVTRLAGALLAAAAGWALWMLVSAPLAAAVCVV